ncbi:hypothetical protein AVEN_41398-1 [Araneus ventricosus]|uniref:Uncharacterized protein n=1 Tax=Araneus ventricosus TaxID=182803 RepID=A0A4Y2LU03_ARAVE|nr:hypothetical protein AVEN_41398-1 [Araneus ventricosus]
MLDSVGGAIGVHFQRCQVFQSQVQKLRIFEQRDPYLSQLESHKQDSSGVLIKLIEAQLIGRLGWPRYCSTTPNPSRRQSDIQIIAHIKYVLPYQAETTFGYEWRSEHLTAVLVKPVPENKITLAVE